MILTLSSLYMRYLPILEVKPVAARHVVVWCRDSQHVYLEFKFMHYYFSNTGAYYTSIV